MMEQSDDAERSKNVQFFTTFYGLIIYPLCFIIRVDIERKEFYIRYDARRKRMQRLYKRRRPVRRA